MVTEPFSPEIFLTLKKKKKELCYTQGNIAHIDQNIKNGFRSDMKQTNGSTESKLQIKQIFKKHLNRELEGPFHSAPRSPLRSVSSKSRSTELRGFC